MCLNLVRSFGFDASGTLQTVPRTLTTYGISIYIKLSKGQKWLLNREQIPMCKQILLITDTSSKVTQQNANLKLNPQRACPFPQYFLYFLKMAHLSCFLSQELISPKLPDYIDFFFPFWQNCFSVTGAPRASDSKLSHPSHWQSLLTLWSSLPPTVTSCLDYKLSGSSPGTAHRILFSSTIPPPFRTLWEVLLKNMPLKASCFPLVLSELSHQDC